MANPNLQSCPFNPYKYKSHFIRHIFTTLFLIVITFAAGLYFAEAGLFAPFAQYGLISPSVTMIAEKSAAPVQNSYEEGYQAALAFARNRLFEEGIVAMDSEPLHFLQATVQSVDGQNVAMQMKASELDIFQEGMANKTVRVPAGLLVEEQIPRDEEEIAANYMAFEKAYQEYEAALAENPDTVLEIPMEPLPYTVQTFPIADLKPGDTLTVRTEADARTADAFDAVYLRLTSRMFEEPVAPMAEEVMDMPMDDLAPASPENAEASAELMGEPAEAPMEAMPEEIMEPAEAIQ